MPRSAPAGLLAWLVAVVFAPTAVAQMNGEMMVSSASAASASAMGDQMIGGKKMMSASGSPLPRTGGMPLMPLLSAAALALMAGSGILATRLARRSS